MDLTKRRGLLALLVVCIVWGTTYYAVRIGVRRFPPLLFSGIRQIIAGCLLLIFIISIKGKFNWQPKNLFKQLIVGILLICLGNGLIGLAEVYIPSGLASLITPLIPLNIVIINFISGKERGINWKIILGIFLGLSGMAFIFKDNLHELANPGYFKGLMMCFVSTVCWSLGTIVGKKFNYKTETLYHNTAMQFVFGGIIMLIAGITTENYKVILLVNSDGWLALSYLIIFGSIIAMLCYNYAIKTLPVNTVSLYAYVNPFIAIILGCFLLNERFTIFTTIAFMLTVSGIYLVNAGNNSLIRKAEI